MIPSEFEYVRPNSLDEVLALMHERPDDCRVMAGGQSLLPMLKLRIIQPTLIVDLSKILGVSSIAVTPNGIEVGAMATERAIELSGDVRQKCPMLAETASVIADPHIRNLGTIGGSLCFADPRGDLPACILALDATLTAASTTGTRTIPATEFFVGPFTTALREDELLVGISVPAKSSRTGAYLKLSKRAGDFAVVAVAADIEWDRDRVCRAARVALCAAGPVPIVVRGMTELLGGSRLDDKKIEEAARHASDSTEPFEDPLVSADYRSAMIHTMVTRALRLTRERAGVNP